MNLYFAAPFSSYFDQVASTSADKILLTYATQGETKKALKLLPQHAGRFKLMVDSGAFSVWMSGRYIPVWDYEWYIKHNAPKLEKWVDELTIVGLDVLPGEFGRRPTEKEAVESAWASYSNWQRMKRAGFKTVPVFHQFEPWDMLKRYCDETDYIGLSPANDQPLGRRLNWLQIAWKYLAPETRVHLFGMVATRVLTTVPTYSADSSSWKAFGKFRRLPETSILPFIDRGKRIEEIGAEWRYFWPERHGVRVTIDEYLHLERVVTELWLRRGVRWEA